MADSIRQQIVDALVARLASIQIANGFETDLGLNVFEWREENLAESELPAAVVRDGEEAHDDGNFGHKSHVLSVEIEIFTDTSGANRSPKMMRKLLADVAKAIGVDDTWAGLADQSRIVSSAMEHDHTAREFSGAFVHMEIEYTTKSWDPYTQG